MSGKGGSGGSGVLIALAHALPPGPSIFILFRLPFVFPFRFAPFLSSLASLPSLFLHYGVLPDFAVSPFPPRAPFPVMECTCAMSLHA